MAPIRTPEESPRLFDMVRVKDERVRPAFYFALRDSLVAQDMEQATRMAFQKDKRWRVVTLKGQIIEMAGTCHNLNQFFFSLASSYADDSVKKIQTYILVLFVIFIGIIFGVCFTGTMTGGGRVLKGRMGSSIGTEVSQVEVSRGRNTYQGCCVSDSLE